MARVFIPPLLRPLTDGVEEIELDAANVGDLIADLERRYPGIRDRLCDGEALKADLSVAKDGNVSSLGLLEPLSSASEVHFLPAIGGGS